MISRPEVEDALRCLPMCACSGELRHVRFFKEIIEPTIAVEAAVVVSVPAQQVIELVSGESTSTPPLEVAGLNGR